MTDHARRLREIYGWLAEPTDFEMVERIADEAADEMDRLRAQYADLLSVVVQPWTRDGDGAKLFKVNLAWWETAKTREEAEEIVEEAIERVKRREASR